MSESAKTRASSVCLPLSTESLNGSTSIDFMGELLEVRPISERYSKGDRGVAESNFALPTDIRRYNHIPPP